MLIKNTTSFLLFGISFSDFLLEINQTIIFIEKNKLRIYS